jgi:hypothetical protein
LSSKYGQKWRFQELLTLNLTLTSQDKPRIETHSTATFQQSDFFY